MNDVCDPRLRSTLNPYRTRVHLHPQILRRTQVSSHFLNPVAAFAIHPSFLAQSQRCQRCYQHRKADEFDCLLQ